MKIFLNIFKRKKIPIEERLKVIKEGNEEERERFISEYIPFIIKAITKTTNRYIEVENNDEYSIGLEAFNEAIDRYDFGKGNFINYAEMVIRSRIIDYQRKQKRINNVISINEKKEEGMEIEDILKNKDFTEIYDIKDQINRFEIKLKEFGITLAELVEESPKHIDTRLNAIRIAKAIVQDKNIMEQLYRRKILPAKSIVEKMRVSKKVLKGNRKFIIAIILILDSELDVLIDYVLGIERREKIGI
ncbi:RNA polymerase sigma factor [Caminicella sporogenes DSM 14501]|uniref:RNA polymerase sigma factor SigI n=1 Tax=Caminicella sporogenes DSM 14501 TaxID=1121266 RepID=A0A1M6QXN0_9FIRM|nr:RNA polymerase sigma-I factor [Caminicella sporogenes]RKD20871.1 RNA polymerase sigma-I factor [Caminicella sporogenes]WIF95736.1 RNA polymerase sigma-I factor [Caminicella sporogenes]SHK24936.1 RNA polymerase sigma factor [Caminicella sporogenes DSM 14501]